MKTLAALLVLTMLAACASGPAPRPQPEWVTGMSARFPASQYLLGRGQAARQDVAADRARADLAKNIEVRVLEKSRDLSRASVRRGDGTEGTRFDQEVSREVRTTTAQVIRGASIADQWQDPATGQVHVLVALKRLEASRALREQIQYHDDLTRVAIERARQSDDLLRKLAAAQVAVDEQLERTRLQRVLRVVGNGGQGIRPRWKLADLQAELKDLQSRLILRVVAEDAALAAAVSAAANQAGFVTVSGEAARYSLHARFDGGPPVRREGWYWLRGNLELSLTDAAGNVRGKASWPIKVSAQVPGDLGPRLQQAVEKTLSGSLRETILGFGR